MTFTVGQSIPKIKATSEFLKKNCPKEASPIGRKFAQSGPPDDEAGLSSDSRVTRLGKCLPFGRLFSGGSGLKITEVAQIFGLLFPTIPVMY
jgi:hypothetical protein